MAMTTFYVTYDANGGSFSDGSLTNRVGYEYDASIPSEVKISKTSNVNDDGSTTTGGYGDN